MATDDRGGDLTCKVVRAGEAYQGKQALSYAPGISAETVGARGINMQVVTIPLHPGGGPPSALQRWADGSGRGPRAHRSQRAGKRRAAVRPG
jgi:hypothetical protein